MKRVLKISLMLGAALVMFSSCKCYKKMAKNIDDVSITANPAVLSLKGTTVSTDVTVDFPAKYYNKKAILKVTPVLVFDGGEIVGTPKYIQGQKAKENYTVIPKTLGGSYTQTVTFPYDERADLSTLELRVDANCGKNNEFMPIAVIPVAQGISTIQKMACNVASMSIMPDNFKRVTTISKEAEIMYLINRSEVRKGELTKDQIKMFEDFVKEYNNKDRATLGNVYAKGYASPDGPIDFNDKLSKDRSQSGSKAIKKKLEGVISDSKYDIAAYGEDWEGFKQLVAASNMKDKDLVLQVLAMYDNPVKRDQEIHNMSQVFDALATDILPQLRRTKLQADVDIEGRTDAEIKAALSGDVNVLSEEEMLYSATLVDDCALKIKAYNAAATKYNSARGYNNMGVVLAKQGKTADARKAIEKAATLSRDAAITNNLGVLALLDGDAAKAKSLVSSLNTADSRKTMGLINLAEGNYAEATKTLDAYNLAVAEVLNGNLSKAKSLLAGEKSAQADYLKAVIDMREGNSSSAISNLKAAIGKDSSLKAKAQKDVEFAKLFGTTEFLAL